MSRRFNFRTEADLWRHVYSGSPKKSILTDQNTSYFGFFQPIDADTNTVALGITSQAYQFVTDGENDVVPSDVLVIDSEQYRVRGVRRNQMKRQDFITCIMELSVKH